MRYPEMRYPEKRHFVTALLVLMDLWMFFIIDVCLIAIFRENLCNVMRFVCATLHTVPRYKIARKQRCPSDRKQSSHHVFQGEPVTSPFLACFQSLLPHHPLLPAGRLPQVQEALVERLWVPH